MRIRIKAPTAPQLIKELQPHLPLPVYLTPEVSQSLREKDKDEAIGPDVEVYVTSLIDSGEQMGGILCALDNAGERVGVVLSLTHLRIRPDHPMRLRIEAYQRERTRKLRRQR
jgi:hypothetical protein